MDGRIPICARGSIKLWRGGHADAELSQHLADRYTYNHVLRGAIFHWLLWAVLRGRLPIAARLAIAVTITGAWEIWENTPFAIGRYRSQTIFSPGFTGDSVIDSMGDMPALILGFLLASRLGMGDGPPAGRHRGRSHPSDRRQSPAQRCCAALSSRLDQGLAGG